MGSRIAEIVDYTAMVAARVPGVVDVFGCGLFYGVKAAADAPSGTYVHWTDMPDAPDLTWLDQDQHVVYNWDVPMRLWLPRSDLANLRRMALPFYDAYLHVFFTDWTLGGLCSSSHISRFERDSDDRYSWLDITLSVSENVEV